jgi:hypothetical protein
LPCLKPFLSCLLKIIVSVWEPIWEYYLRETAGEFGKCKICHKNKSPLSLQEKLDRAITDEINAKITSKTRTLKDITSVVKKELINFEIEGKRRPNLEKAYNYLNTIPSASVEAERVFSDCGNFGTKIIEQRKLGHVELFKILL